MNWQWLDNFYAGRALPPITDADLDIRRALPPRRYDPFSLTDLPAFWEGALATRRSRLADGDDTQKPAIDRSEMIIARMAGEDPIPGRWEPLSDEERTRHYSAITRLDALREAAVAWNGESPTGEPTPPPRRTPEFIEWLAGGKDPLWRESGDSMESENIP